jgi:hypothetical protein
LFLKSPGVERIILFDVTIENIIFIQTNILAGLIVVGVFLRNIRLELLKPSKTDMVTNYLDFIFQSFKGLGSAIFLYILFELLNWLPPSSSSTANFPNFQDILLIIASLSVILSSQSPEGSTFTQLMVSELFLVSETRFERLRDALFKISIIILAYIHVVPLISNGKTLVSQVEWNDGATLIFVIAIITFVVSLFNQKPEKTNVSGQIQDFLDGKAGEVNLLTEKFKEIRETIQDASVDPNSTQFFKLNDDFPIVNKEKTKFIAKKNSVAIPVKETSEGVAIVFVGENELIETKPGSLDSIPTVQKIGESATATIISNSTWQSAFAKLEAIKPTDETINALALKGIETRDKLVSLAEDALSDFKQITLSQNITSKIQDMMVSFQQGRYFISDTKKGTHISLPGITIIENEGYTFVRLFGLKVLDAKGSTVVSMPFLKVIDTPNYDYVNLPFLKVIDTAGSTLVNIAGFQITEGDPQHIQTAIKQIASDSKKLTSAFDQLDSQLESILSAPEQLMLTKTTAGNKLELVSGVESDNALFSGDLLTQSFKKSRKKINREKHKDHKEKQRVKSGVNIKVGLFSKNVSSIKEDIRIDKNQLELLEKFSKIIKVSQGDIVFERLTSLLHFKSIEQLEDWLINLGLTSLQINWEENKLVLNDKIKSDLQIELSSLKKRHQSLQ